MALNSVHRVSLCVNFKSTTFSRATAFKAICFLVNLVLTAVLIYMTDGFRLDVCTFAEQPKVSFKEDLLLDIALKHANGSESNLIWRNKTVGVNNSNGSRNGVSDRTVQVEQKEIDINDDGKPEQLAMNITFPYDGVNFERLQMMVILGYKLRKKIRFEMETAAHFVTSRSSTGTGNLEILSELRLKQNELLECCWNNRKLNDKIMSENDTFQEVLKSNLHRNFTTHPGHDTIYLWSESEDRGNFTIKLTIFVPEQIIYYEPGIWYQLKWITIQYVAIFAILYVVIEHCKNFVFTNQIVGTLVEYPKIPRQCYELHKQN